LIWKSALNKGSPLNLIHGISMIEIFGGTYTLSKSAHREYQAVFWRTTYFARLRKLLEQFTKVNINLSFCTMQ